MNLLDSYRADAPAALHLSPLEYRPECRGGMHFLTRYASRLPAYRPGTFEHYLRLSHEFAAQGLPQKSRFWAAQALAAEAKATKLTFGNHLQDAISSAHFMAACLTAHKLPRGASRTIAQLALEGWLPDLPRAERLEIIETLRHCSTAQLGRRLHALVQASRT